MGRPGGQLAQRGQPLGPVETAYALASLAQEQSVVQRQAEEGQEVAEKVLVLGGRLEKPASSTSQLHTRLPPFPPMSR